MKKLCIYGLYILNLCIIISAWWHFSGATFMVPGIDNKLLALGRITGLLATYHILIQLILIGRVKWVESVFGLDKLSRVHKWNGYSILGAILLHPILITIAYSNLAEVGVWKQFITLLTEWEDVLLAAIGLGVFIVTIGLSIVIVRKRLKYETWYYVHVFNYAAIALVFFHQMNFGPDSVSRWFVTYWYALYIVAFGNIIWFRFIRPLIRTWYHGFRIEKVVPEGPATSIYITGKHMERFKIQAGQFMIFRFLQRGFWWQAHPFSLSQGPNGRNLRLTAKKLGDFTNTMPNLQAGTKIIIDGPHGIFTEQVITEDKLLFIAGGIGITPIRSLLEALGPKRRDMILLYSNKTQAEIVFKQELDSLAMHYGFTIHYVLSDETADRFIHGFIDQALVAKLVPDVTTRDIFLCGPPPMMAALRKALARLGVPNHYVHYEKFSL